MSSNIVGYHKMELGKGLTILGSQFVSVGDTAIDIQDVADGDFAAGDRLLFYDAGTYMIYTYDTITYDDSWETDLGPGWVDPVEGTRAIRQIQPGEGFWYDCQTVSGNDVTLAGEVPDTTSITISGGGALNLVTIPEPISGVSINSLVFNGVKAGDRLMFFDNGTYMIYTYDTTTYDDTWEDDLGPGWVDPIEGTRAVRAVGINEGFWIQAEGAGNVTISLP